MRRHDWQVTVLSPSAPSSRALRVVATTSLLVVVGALAQFVRGELSAPAEWDFGVACDGGTPYYTAVCYRGLTRAGDLSRTYDPNAPAVVIFSDTPADSPQHVLATFADVGAVWGLAYSRSENAVYASAFQKRQFLFGPGGPGAIYRIDLTSGDVLPFATVPNVRENSHDPTSRSADIEAGRLVGRTSLGDLDLSDDEETLFVVNADDGRVYRFAMPEGRLVGSFPNGASSETWANQARPFGLGLRGGLVYHGVVNSGELTGRIADLKAVVYESRPDGSAMRKVLEVPLDYVRGSARFGGAQARVTVDWRPWRDGVGGTSVGWPPVTIYPMPVLSDIVFDSGGDMVLGFRDRHSDATQYFATIITRSARRDDEGVGYGFGEILLGTKDGAGWSVDTRREFYRDGLASYSDETASGGLAVAPDANDVATGSLPASGDGRIVRAEEGVYWYDGSTGERTGHEHVCEVLTPFNPALPPRVGSSKRPATDLIGLIRKVGRHAGRGWTGRVYADNGEPTQEPPPPKIRVRGPSTIGDVEALCRAAIPSSTPTSTPTGTSTSTATASPTPPATSTQTPAPIYLPINLREEGCVPGGHHTDVAIIVDASTSMEEFTRAGRPKIDAAREAAALFIAKLDLTGGDQAAMVQFNSSGEVLQALTDDAGALNAALGRIRLAQQTRIQIGLELANQELLSPRHRPQNSTAAILLTDGRNNPEPVGVAVAAADLAKRAGIRIFTIGLGSELDLEALAAMASSPDGFYLAPDGEDLVEIYRQIANIIPCPPKEYWPGRLWP